MRQYSGIDAGAVVSDGDGDALAAGGVMAAWRGAEMESSALGESVDGVADEVGEDLADFAVVGLQLGGRTVATVHDDAGALNAGVEQVEDGVDDLDEVDGAGAGGALVEAQRLHGDLGDAVELLLGGIEEGAVIGREVGLGDEVEAVGDGFEGVVDLVGDGGGEAAGDGEFFGAAEEFLAFFLEGEVGDEGCDLAVAWSRR